jgi:hypothetical protein
MTSPIPNNPPSAPAPKRNERTAKMTRRVEDGDATTLALESIARSPPLGRGEV